jgi:hypothetical protein
MTPRAEVREEKQWGVEFPGQEKLKDAIQSYSAMLCQNTLSGFLPCQTWHRKESADTVEMQRNRCTTTHLT